ncbi:unnamed protein product [Cunninghamella blakesleeana]
MTTVSQRYFAYLSSLHKEGEPIIIKKARNDIYHKVNDEDLNEVDKKKTLFHLNDNIIALLVNNEKQNLITENTEIINPTTSTEEMIPSPTIHHPTKKFNLDPSYRRHTRNRKTIIHSRSILFQVKRCKICHETKRINSFGFGGDGNTCRKCLPKEPKGSNRLKKNVPIARK